MNILLALIPAIGWGIQPLLLAKIGGKPSNQILGTGVGALFIGLAIQLILRPASVSASVFWLSVLSGLFWVIGQVGQYLALKVMGVAQTMPLTTALQLIGTTVISVIFFGEWQSTTSKIYGVVAIILLIIGVVFTSYQEHASAKSTAIRGFLILLSTSIGYWIYSILPKMVHASGMSIFFPQMLGVFLGAIVYVLIVDRQAFKEKVSWKLIIIGLIFSLSALAYIFSAQQNGVATAFILTQLNVVVATLGGLLLLKEHKTKKELIFTILGLVLIVTGSVITVFLK